MAGTLKSVEVIPQGSSIERSKTEQFNAIGHYSDGSTADLTATAAWVSTVTTVATVSAAGLATGVTLGTTSITATSGGFSGSVILTIVPAKRAHITPPFIMNTPLGHLKFRQSIMYNTPKVVAGPDPHPGHISHNTTGTVVLPPKQLDALQPILMVSADIPAPGLLWEGRLVKDLAYPVQRLIESPTSSDSTATIWRKGKTFAGKIKF